ncbi:MAG TPA: hypothetical protein EYP51_06720 [Thiotrichales bacterium]|nr:hypothetical protein [Thiotrichales bacterium]
MGAYIYYKTAEKSLAAANEAARILDVDKFNQALRRIDVCAFTVWSERDLEWGRKEPNSEYWEKYFLDHLGEGDYKVSALDEDKLARIKVDYDSFFEKSTRMFERLNKHTGMQMRYLSVSCAFSGDYYTDEQIARITHNGELLSGANKEDIQMRIGGL